MFWLIFGFNYRFYFAKTGENGPAVNPSRQAKRQAQRLKGAVREQTGGRANRQDERLERLKKTVRERARGQAKQPKEPIQIALSPDLGNANNNKSNAVRDGAGGLQGLNLTEAQKAGIMDEIIVDRGLGILGYLEGFPRKDVRNWLLSPDNKESALAILKQALSNPDFSKVFGQFEVDPSTLNPEQLFDEIRKSPELINAFAKTVAALQRRFASKEDDNNLPLIIGVGPEADAVAAGTEANTVVAGTEADAVAAANHFEGVRRVKAEVREKKGGIRTPKSLVIGISAVFFALVLALSFALSSTKNYARAQEVPTVNLDPTTQHGYPGQPTKISPPPPIETPPPQPSPQPLPTVNLTVTTGPGHPEQPSATPPATTGPTEQPPATPPATPEQEQKQEPTQTVTIIYVTPTGKPVVIRDIRVSPPNLSGAISEERKGIALPEGVDVRVIAVGLALAIIAGIALGKIRRR